MIDENECPPGYLVGGAQPGLAFRSSMRWLIRSDAISGYDPPKGVETRVNGGE